jgi:hypothetical protein
MNLDSSRFKKSFLGKGGPWADDTNTMPSYLAASELPQVEPAEKILAEDFNNPAPVLYEGTKLSDKVIHSSQLSRRQNKQL